MFDKNKFRNETRARKKRRIHKKIMGTPERPRLVVYRSAKNIYAQLVDDTQNRTLGGTSTLSPNVRKKLAKAEGKLGAAKLVGEQIAEKAKSLKIDAVVFDRGGYLYHGRIKAVADGAREKGLNF